MKETAAAAGLPVPAWMAITRPADAAPLLEAHGRIILKPRGGTGSTGLFDASSPADLARIDARDDVDFSNYLAEQYVDADMIHIDGVVYDGRLLVCSVSRYLQSTRTYSAGGAYLASIMLDADDPVAVAAGAFTRSVVDAFSVCHAVLHLECFARPDGDLVFCEVACRAGGGGIVKTVEATHGINLFEAMVDVALSRRPELSRTRLTPSAGFVLFYPRRGIFAGVHDEAVPAHWVIDRRVNAKLGHRLDDAWIAGGALATYVIGGSGSAEVARRIADLVRAVRIDIDH
jgi:biotin carboxylase